MESLPIVLPAPPAEPRRPPVPIMAALVPVAAGIVLWLVTGSLYALCFAALGPLMVAASLVDGARTRRKERRRAVGEASAAWDEVDRELGRRQGAERSRRRMLLPDVASCLVDPPLRGAHPVDEVTPLVVGAGSVPSGFRVSGGDDTRGRAFQERSTVLEGAPIAVPLGNGVCLRGARPVVHAVLRALIAQLCLRFSPAQLALVGEERAWRGADALPHAGRGRRGAFRVAVADGDAPAPPAEAVMRMLGPGADVPDGITTVIDVSSPRRATMRTPQGVVELAVEAVSAGQFAEIASACAAAMADADMLPESVDLSDLTHPASSESLPVAIGRGERGAVIVDLVEDGPHAIVTGTTGTGKSELLVTWVTALAAQYGPERVTFVLADFKGGTAFEPLRELRHVAAVITDLDDSGARRGVSSLRAELRRREAVLANAGARDVRQVTSLPRLVIVIDEFAALMSEHPDLAAVFTDVAARGRALGMHLVLGTQRATGVIREALAANCPLRISLRVSDAADSRSVIGTDAAAELPGGAESRGLGLVRRPQDAGPIPMRVALTSAADLRTAAVRWGSAPAPASPWLPPLPRMLPLAQLVGGRRFGTIVVLGRSDDPERQAQPREQLRPGEDRGLAIVGAPGSGRTSALRTITSQRPDAAVVPDDLEIAWDLLESWTESAEARPSLIVCDDLDTLFDRYEGEHAQLFARRWELLLRAGGGVTAVVASGRTSGAVGRLLDALPRRALLRLSGRVEHIAAGGTAATFDPDRPPGRASMGERELQFAWVDDEPQADAGTPSSGPERRTWVPTSGPTALVSAGAPMLAEQLARAHPGCRVVTLGSSPIDHVGDTEIFVGDAQAWQRQWSLWQHVRAHGEVLVRAEHASEFRQLTGMRGVPPYAALHAGRAWSVRGAGEPRRIVLPVPEAGC